MWWDLAGLRAAGQLLPSRFYNRFRGRDWLKVAAPNAYPAIRDGWPFWRLVLRGLVMRVLLRTPFIGYLIRSRTRAP
jgi:hypothetical protein